MKWTLTPKPEDYCTPEEQARLERLKAETLTLARRLETAQTPEQRQRIAARLAAMKEGMEGG